MKLDEEITVSELRLKLSDLVNEAAFAKKHIVLNRRGKRVAAIVPIEDLELIKAIKTEKKKARKTEKKKAIKQQRSNPCEKNCHQHQ